MRWPGTYSVSTLSSRGSIIDALNSGYSNRCIAPNVMSLGPKLPMRCSGDQVSLNIEGVVDGGVERNKVRMVQEHRGDQASQWAAIAAKIGCSGETLRNWVRQAERDAGVRPGATTDEPAMAA